VDEACGARGGLPHGLCADGSRRMSRGGTHEQGKDAPHVRPASVRGTPHGSGPASARAQGEAVALIVDTMARELAARPRTLFVVGSYRIGKERAYLGAARALRWKVFCTPDKRKARAACTFTLLGAALAGSTLAGLLQLILSQ
jgi:hypothetical protein